MAVQSWRLDFAKIRNVSYSPSTRYSDEVRSSDASGALAELKHRYPHKTHNHDDMLAALQHDPDGHGFVAYRHRKSGFRRI